MSKFSPREARVLALALVIVAALVGLVTWASYRQAIADGTGPRGLAVNNGGRVFVAFRDSLVVLDGSGTVIAHPTAEQLGIDPPIGGLAPTPNGEILIGSMKNGRIIVVNQDGSRQRQMELSLQRRGDDLSSFHFAQDPETGTLLVTDTSNHHLLALDSSGKVIRQVGSPDNKPGELHFPNGIVVGADGRIYVADTNHHAVKIFDDSLAVRETRDIRGGAGGGFTWPVYLGMDAARNLYVTYHGSGLEEGDIVKFGPDGKTSEILSLPPGTKPAQFAVRESDLLIPDTASFRVLRVGHDGKALGDFGSSGFQKLLDDDRRIRDRFGSIAGLGRLSLVLILLSLLLLLFLARRRVDRRPLAVPVQAEPRAEGGWILPSLGLQTSFMLLWSYPAFVDG